jgi:hypothetical protein
MTHFPEKRSFPNFSVARGLNWDIYLVKVALWSSLVT